MSPDTRPGPSGLLLAAAGAGVFLLVLFAGRSVLLAKGFPAASAMLQATVLALSLELVWLPLLGTVFLESGSRGLREVLSAAAGALLAGCAAGLWGQPSCLEVLWAEIIVIAFACLVLAVGSVPMSLALRPAVARVCASVCAALLISVPFWSQPVVESLESAAWREAARHVATWFSPLALITLPFESFDLATLGRMYGIMRGPVIPYPPHAAAAAAAYGMLATLIAGFGLALQHLGLAPAAEADHA